MRFYSRWFFVLWLILLIDFLFYCCIKRNKICRAASFYAKCSRIRNCIAEFFLIRHFSTDSEPVTVQCPGAPAQWGLQTENHWLMFCDHQRDREQSPALPVRVPALHKSILTPELGWSGRQGGNYQDYIKVNTNPGLVGDILSSCQYNQWRICVNGRGNVGKYPTYPDKCMQCCDHGASTLRWWCELRVTCEQQQWEYLGVARSRKLAQREARQPGQQVNINKYYEPGLQPHPSRALDIQSAYSDSSLFYHLCDKM